SSELPSPESGTGGTVSPKTEQGHETVTVLPALGAPMLPESSTARTSIVAEGLPWTLQAYVHELVPLAGVQVEPPSVETSTAATTPPPSSEAVPEIVTVLPSDRFAPAAGEATVALGGVVSVDPGVATRPACRVAGWVPMSAIRLTVAC